MQLGISLKENIFLKEENLQPNKTLDDIVHFKLAARLFSLFMIASILTLAGINEF